MKFGICVCGLNGSGKTTLAEALAKELNFKHIDIEHYYFESSDNPYSSSRPQNEVELLLLKDMKQYSCFVFSAVNGNYTAEINSFYNLIIYLEAPLEVRMERIKRRAVDRFGNRVLFGGDMYLQEEEFFAYARSRMPEKILNWLKKTSCKVIRLDGTKPIEENIRVIKGFLSDYF